MTSFITSIIGLFLIMLLMVYIHNKLITDFRDKVPKRQIVWVTIVFILLTVICICIVYNNIYLYLK